jgi:riboflavin synthase
MFTGIVQGVFPIASIEEKPGLRSIAVKLPGHLCESLNIGASVSVDGVCLTVTALEDNKISFDVMSQTLAITTLGVLKEGGRVNI